MLSGGGVELTPWKPSGGGDWKGAARDSGTPSERKRVAGANAQANSFFRMLLGHETHGAEARAYLERRGVSAEMIETFELGYAPEGWDGLAKTIASKGWPLDDHVLAQVVKPRKQGDGHFDFLRHRLVFPILDGMGRPIAFGGRQLREEDDPKYLNSPETALFNKSATLYGLHAAKRPIMASRTAVIVEGYTDVIACHQAGATNVVAALGTALTAEHVRELRKYCDHVILVMDGDSAGQKAADRAVEVFLTGELDISMAVLPEGQDPDDLLSEGGLEAWETVLAQAADALDFAYNRASQRMDAQETLTGSQRAAEAFLNQVVDLGLTRTGQLRRAMIVRKLSTLLKIGESDVDKILRERSTRSSRSVAHSPSETQVSADYGEPWGPDSEPLGSVDESENYVHLSVADPGSGSKLKAVLIAERRFIAGLVRYNGLFATTLDDGRGLDEAIAASDFVEPNLGRLYQRIYDALAEGRGLTLASLLSDLAAEGEKQLSRLLTSAEFELPSEEPAPDAADSCESSPSPSGIHVMPPALIQETWTAAFRAMIARQQEHQYEQTRRALRSGSEDGNPAATDPVILAQKIAEHRRNNPSPGRIPRLRR